MTVKELSKLYWLNREVEFNKRELKELEKEIQHDTEELIRLRGSIDGLHSPNMDAMPHGSEVSSPVESIVLRTMILEGNLKHKHEAELNLKARISAKQALCALERVKLEQYIGGIDDPYLRLMFSYRFVDGYTWQKIAETIGHVKGWESIRKSCYRYIREH